MLSSLGGGGGGESRPFGAAEDKADFVADAALLEATGFALALGEATAAAAEFDALGAAFLLSAAAEFEFEFATGFGGAGGSGALCRGPCPALGDAAPALGEPIATDARGGGASLP